MSGTDDPNVPFPVELQRRLMNAIRGETALRRLTREEAQLSAKRLLAESRGAGDIDRKLRDNKLVPMVTRAQGYAPFARTKSAPKVIVVVPYASPERDSAVVGGVGLSEGEAASGVMARIEEQRLVSFTSFDLLAGELVSREFQREDLLGGQWERFREDLPRDDEPPDFDSTVSSGIASESFQVLLFDEHSSAVHTPEAQQNMVLDLPLVTSMAELQYLRLQGLAASPGASCCCCCCCCWGSCSSCA